MHVYEQVGLPKHAVAVKLVADGLDAGIAELDPGALVSLTVLRTHTPSAAAPAAPAGTGPMRQPRESLVRKKKLFLTAVQKGQLSADSLWGMDNEDIKDIQLDADEFAALFTESLDQQAKLKTKAQQLEDEDTHNKMKRIKGVSLISIKRAQNAAIALARIKLSYEEIRCKVTALDDAGFTVDQLKALLEYLPSEEEVLLLQRYAGDVNLLGLAEKFMLVMVSCTGAKARLNALIAKRQFLPRWHDLKHKYGLLEAACDEIKKSARLKKVLKTILKVANQLNDEQQAGITVDSLVKLATIKAFDKKTSILQYVIMLIHRHDSDALLFPDDLKHLAEASRLGLDSLNSEKAALTGELSSAIRAIRNLKEHRCTDDEPLGAMIESMDTRLTPMCAELDKRVSTLSGKFQSILRYFCEDAKLSCQEFFVPLNKFVEDFVHARDAIEKQRQAEARKQRIAQAKANAAAPHANMVQARRRLSIKPAADA